MNDEYIPAEYVVIAQDLRADMAKKLSKRHKMRVIGISGGLADCVNVLGLRFEMTGPVTKERLREILVNCVEEFLAAINANERLRPFLKNFPFTSKEIEIIIFVSDKKGYEIFDPDIGVASAVNGKISYNTTDRANPYGYKGDFIENYEEALEFVKNSRK